LYWCKHHAHLLEKPSRSDLAAVFHRPNQRQRGEISGATHPTVAMSTRYSTYYI